MTTEDRDELIVLVTDSQSNESHLRKRLEREPTVDVRSVTMTDDRDAFEAALVRTIESEPTDGSSTATGTDDETTTDGGNRWRPRGIVVELESETAIRTVLERVHDRLGAVPTIVTPSEGREEFAVAALRADATEYVPIDNDENTVDRIVDTIQTHSGAIPGEESYHRILATELPDEAFVIDENGTYLEAKVRPNSAELYTMSPDELPGTQLVDAFPEDTAEQLQSCIERALCTGDVQSLEYDAKTTEGRCRFEGRVVPIDERVDGRRAVVWLARDITERAQRERELRSRQDRLETLNRINAVVRQVIETLVEAPARDTIEREVCEQLVDSELYCGAWIAERTGEGKLSYRTGAGSAETYLERVREQSVEREDRPVFQAARRGEIQTTNRLLEDGTVPEGIRDAACEDDIRAGIAVPIAHEDAIYGVLTVLASRDDAFSEHERAGFRLLGETIGFTIMAVKNRQLLFADSVVELEFRIDGGDTFSFDLSREYDCTCALEWAGTTASGQTFQYVTIEEIDGETVLEEARAHDSVEECRLIHDGNGRCTIEIRLAKSGVRTLANHGATIRDVTVEDGIGRCLVEISQDADIREIADALTVVYENTELVARREVDRTVRTAAERRNRILDQLTDRQLTTLRLAYYSGFYEWPRESTGEEIAESMGVSAPTMHQHLRKGLKTVLGEFFETGGSTD